MSEPNVSTANARPPAPHEPVAHEPRSPAPPCDVGPPESGGWLRRIMPLLMARKRLLVIALTCAAVALAAQVAVPRTLMAAIDDALIARTSPLGVFVAILVGLAVVRGLFTWLHRDLLFQFAYDLEADLRVLLYGHMGQLSSSFFDRTQAAELISRANTDIRSVQMFITFGPLMVLNVASFGFAFGLMIVVSVPLTLLALAPMPALVWLGIRMRRDLYPVSWLLQARQAEVAGLVEDNVTGVQIVRALAAEQRQLDTLVDSARRLGWTSRRQLAIRGRDAPLIENVPRIGMAALLGVGGWLALQGQVTIGAIAAFSGYVGMLQAPFRMIGAVIMLGQRASASAARILEVLDQRPDVTEQPGAHTLDRPSGHVEFDDVRFGYEEGPPVLDGFSLRVSPGETVALVGRTGCGKSTVGRLLARFYDVDGGAVRIDGHDVRSLTPPSLRASVGVVTDDPFLFAERIREQIRYGRPDADEHEVLAAARDAAADEFVARIEGGYDARLSERGSNLSGGQRQRLAIARSMLADPQIVVFDDATSAVDARTEERIHASLRRRGRDRTTILIAHRLSTIALAERVVLIDEGKVIAEGSHEELLRTQPRYRQLLSRGDPDEPGGPDVAGAEART